MPRERKLPPGLWKRGRVYHARFRAGGMEIRKRLSTDFKAACELLNELRARADKADFGLLDNDYAWQSLKTEFLKWARQSLRPRVAEEYERDLKKFADYVNVRTVRQIDTQLIIGFRDWRMSQGTGADGKPTRPVTARTINRQVGTIHNMLARGVEWSRIAFNPLANLEPLRHDAWAKERRALTSYELMTILDASPVYLRSVWRMFMCTGIRKNELVSMKFADVDFGRRTVTVRAGTAKSHKAREIPLDDETLAMLAELKKQASRRQHVEGLTQASTAQQRANFTREHVFVSRANTPLRNNLLARFYAVCKRAGIEDAVPGGSVDIHSLRVSFTTLSLENGANPRAVQAILGHTTLGMTMGVYARATEHSKREAISALPFAVASPPKHLIPVQIAHKMRTSAAASTDTAANKALA
jgi:integrase